MRTIFRSRQRDSSVLIFLWREIRRWTGSCSVSGWEGFLLWGTFFPRRWVILLFLKIFWILWMRAGEVTSYIGILTSGGRFCESQGVLYWRLIVGLDHKLVVSEVHHLGKDILKVKVWLSNDRNAKRSRCLLNLLSYGVVWEGDHLTEQQHLRFFLLNWNFEFELPGRCFNQTFLLQARMSTCQFLFWKEKSKTKKRKRKVWKLTSPCLSWNIVPASIPRLNKTWPRIL